MRYGSCVKLSTYEEEGQIEIGERGPGEEKLNGVVYEFELQRPL
jgi:hypothetical protein